MRKRLARHGWFASSRMGDSPIGQRGGERHDGSCEQANAYAIEARAAMAVTAPPRFAGMPSQLAQSLRSRPPGHPTPPFGELGKGVRIPILCPTGFQLAPPPAKAGPADEI
jgi:hypothetical protein